MFRKFSWPDIGFDELKKRARLLVIDDNPFEYEKLFKDAQYALDKWDDIKDLNALESGIFDIILLDIQGVGREFSPEQGFGVLKHLKKVNPSQIIIAYSNADYKLVYQDFFKLANDTLDKSDDFYIYKQKVDHFIKIRFSYNYYLGLIESKLGNEQDRRVIRKYFDRSIKDKNPKYFEKKLQPLQLSKETLYFLMNVINFAISTYITLRGLNP